MNKRAQRLASRLDRANNQLIAAIQQISEADWQEQCAEDARPVGVVVRHITDAHTFVLSAAQAVATSGRLPTLTWEKVHMDKAEHGRKHAHCDQAETLDMLRRTSRHERRAAGTQDTWELDGEVTVQQVIERHMIDHVQGHLANIETAVRAW